MDMKRVVIGAVVGGVTLHILAFLTFGMALAGYEDVFRGTPAAFRDVPLEWSFALGDLALGTLVALGVIARGATSLASGFITGAVIGFLVWFGVNFITYGGTMLWTPTAIVVGTVVGSIIIGLTGAVVVAVLARVPRSAAIRPAE